MNLLRITGFIFIGFLALGSLLWWGCGPHQPSDSTLTKRFYRQRPDLERLVAMIDEDQDMSRIAPDFTWRQDNVAWPRPESEWGISQNRWDGYRRIFARDGFAAGLARPDKSSDVIVIVWAWGIVPAGISVGYLHCGKPQNGSVHTEPPCIAKSDAGSGMYGKSTSYGYRYKKISGDWFIYEQSN